MPSTSRPPSIFRQLLHLERLRRRLGLSYRETLDRLVSGLHVELDLRRRAEAREDADHPAWVYGQ